MAQILTIPAHQTFLGIPSVEPKPAPPDDYEHINATGADFGAQVGAAEKELGAGALKAGEFYSQAAGEQAYTQLQHEYNNLLFGDPSNPADVGYLGLNGQEAMEARPRIQQQMEAALQRISGTLTTGTSQLYFEKNSRRLQAVNYEQMGRHYEQQANVWGASVQEGAALADQRSAGLNYNDDEFLKHKIADQDVNGTRLTQHTGKDPIAQAAKFKSDLVHSAINGAIAHNDFARAQHLQDTFGTFLDPAVGATVAGHLRAQNTAAEGAALYRDASGSGEMAPGGVASGGAAPQAPAQYAPLIKNAADQYGVPEELLTRLLSAENGFKPTGVSSAGARGIAQFIPATAAKYGIDPDDPTQAIPGAAHYLADLKAETGTWNGAVHGYLGSDPHKDASYTQNGVPQLIDTLDRGGAPTALYKPGTLAPGTEAGTAAERFAAGAARPTGAGANGIVPPGAPAARGGVEVWGDSLGVGLQGAMKVGGSVHGGITPTAIFNNIKVEPADHWQGKTVVLPSGSNGNQMPVVEDTIKYLKANGANVIAVGYGPKFPEKNAALAEIAARQQVPVVAAEDVGAAEGIHPSPGGYRTMAQKIGTLAAGPEPAFDADGKMLPPSSVAAPATPAFDTQHADGMVKPGNLDPWNRPVLHNPDGGYSTTSSISISTDAGEVLIPTVMGHPPGRLSNDDAIAHFKATGENLGTFSTADQANAYATKLHEAQASMYDASGNPKAPAAAPDQLQGQPAPLAGARPAGNAAPTMPPGSPAPGVADIATLQVQNATDYARTLARISQRAASASPQAVEFAERAAQRDYQRKELVLSGQMKALTEAQNAAVTGYVKELRPDTPVPPDFYDRITADGRLNGESLKTLYALAELHAKKTVAGDITQYGPKFYEAYNRLTLDDTDPQRLRDVSQLLPMAAPKPDGSQDITLAGVGKLTQAMDELKKRDPILAERKKELMGLIMPLDRPIEEYDLPARTQRYQLGWDIDQQIAQAQHDKKNPYNLFNPASPDFLGKHYQEQIDANALKRKIEGDPALKSEAGIVAAVKAGKLTRDQAAEALRRIGVPFVDPSAPGATAPRPEAPLAQ